MMLPKLAPRWQERLDLLEPSAVAGAGDAARRLAQKLLAMPTQVLQNLSGVCGPSLIVAQGPVDLLPWVDGVVYLGRDPRASSLLVPTNLIPDVPLPLFERALVRSCGLPQPLGVLASPPIVASLAMARSIDRAALETWLTESP